MTTLARVRVTWTGPQVVGPSVSTFYSVSAGGGGLADDLADFFGAITSVCPDGMQWNVQSSGDLINAESGALEGAWSAPGSGGTVTANGDAIFVLGVGCRVRWNTNGLHAGRRVKGTTFVVPLAGAMYEGAGALTAGCISTLQSAADALIAANPGFAVWSRPQPALPGAASDVVSALVPDAVSWLRSRRT